MLTRLLLPTLALASAAEAATPELRGVWVTTTGISTGTIASPLATNTNFARLRTLGLNSVYMDVWRNGATYFPSKTVQQITGQQQASDAGGRDVFGDTLLQSHRNGMAQFAWLQYGFATEFSSTNAPANALSNHMKNKGWLLKDASGAYSNGTYKFAWMNPLVPEVRQFIINMSVELVRKYDLDGIQFDDRLAWPVQFGYDDVTRATYLAETGRALPTNASDAQFTAWRAGKVTAFAKEFSAAIRAENPNVLVAAAPGGYSNTYATYCVDAATWSRSTVQVKGVTYPLFDEITPQIYSSIPSNFNGVWNQNLAALNPATRDDYGVGISINGGSGPYGWETINKPQADYERSTNTKGHIWWYSDGVLNTDEAKLTSYYDVAGTGHAVRPDRGADWRPAPLVAASAGGGRWQTTLAGTERYQVVGRVGDTWTVLLNTVLPGGSLTLNLGGSYGSVEVLIDRRGFTAGDANFDGRVDLTDFFLLQRNFNSTAGTWNVGDFTLDGTVDASDLGVLAEHWGAGTAPGSLPAFASLVPEPGVVLILVGALLRRRSRPRMNADERG